MLEQEIETWMTPPPEEALKLQHPLFDGCLKLVAQQRYGS
jgi:putative SOS response-associated peptidase YedK